jgi:hypothetical protein
LIALFFDYNGPAIKNQGVGNLWAIEQSRVALVLAAVKIGLK